ncbi:MAG: MaoC family dehydratase N-terminal domain-containing protein [Pseudomonadales bacterium]
MPLLTDEHRAWIGTEEARVTVEVSRRDIQKYAAATEQRLHKYLIGDEAPPMFIFNLFSEIPALENLRSDGLARGGSAGPKLPLKRIMAGGTEIRQHRPIKPGDILVGTRRVTDIYEKEGKSGPLIFTVRELAITTQSGERVMEEIQTGIAR